MGIPFRHSAVDSEWRAETLRTNLWLIPAAESAVAVLLFAVTLGIDHAASRGEVSLPSWVISGSPDAARQILASLAAAVITVVGVVFSIMMVVLTLASTQFGPRMLRTFIRDRGTQLTLGTFVATFFYAMLVLISIGSTFVPHLSVTTAIAATAIDLGVLIYFIHHTATAIQLPEVIASIARDLAQGIDAETAARAPHGLVNGPGLDVLQARLDRAGQVITAPASGYLRFVRHGTLTRIAAENDAVIRLHHRPGHFLTRGHPMATVWPPNAAGTIGRRLERVQITGPLRTLGQDISFGIDQLAEIAIRALSPAVNDTFTALTCIDWLGDSLCKIAVDWDPQTCHRDGTGQIRLITAPVSYERLVQRSFEKIRQAADGMPAVLIRQLDALGKVMAVAPASRSQVLLDQAAMIQRLSLRTVPEAADQADVTARYETLLALHARAVSPGAPAPGRLRLPGVTPLGPGQVGDPTRDVDGVRTKAPVIACGQGHLHRHSRRHQPRGNLGRQAGVETPQLHVEQAKRRCGGAVTAVPGIGRLAPHDGGEVTHPGGQLTAARRQVVVADARRAGRDVHDKVMGALKLGHDPQYREQEPQVGRDG